MEEVPRKETKVVGLVGDSFGHDNVKPSAPASTPSSILLGVKNTLSQNTFNMAFSDAVNKALYVEQGLRRRTQSMNQNIL